MESAQPDELKKSTPGPGRHLHHSSDATDRLLLHLRMKPSIARALIHVPSAVKEKGGFRSRRNRIRKCRSCLRLSVRQNVQENCATLQKNSTRTSFLERAQKKSLRARHSVRSYVAQSMPEEVYGSVSYLLLAKARGP